MFDELERPQTDRSWHRGATDDELCAHVLELERMRQQLDADEAATLGELDARGATDIAFGMRTGPWLAREASLPASVAKKRVTVGAKLRRWFPEIAAALGDGRLGWDHARVIAELANPRIVDELAALQETLIGLAAGTTFDRWQQEVRGLAELLDQDGGYDPNRDLARNELSLTRTTDGLTHLRGRLADELGIPLEQAIALQADKLAKRYAADHERCPEIEIPSRTTLQALALAELLRMALATDVEAGRPPRPEVAVRIRAEAPDAVLTPDGVRVQDGSLRTLICGADLYAIVVDSLGLPLDLGRMTRYASEYQRRALLERDGGCTFAGCDAPGRWCDAHHVEHWEHGGHTDVARMVFLCRHHHRVTHRRDWRLDITDDQWCWWTTPNGQTFWSQRHGRQRAGPAPPPSASPATAPHQH